MCVAAMLATKGLGLQYPTKNMDQVDLLGQPLSQKLFSKI